MGATSRQIEAWALTETSLRMQTALDGGNPDSIRDSLRLNWRLWTLFQADLLGAECPLPDDLRSNLLSLAAFIDRQTVTLLSKISNDDVSTLIEINRNLALGLYAEPSDSAAADSRDAVAPAASATPVSYDFSV